MLFNFLIMNRIAFKILICKFHLFFSWSKFSLSDSCLISLLWWNYEKKKKVMWDILMQWNWLIQRGSRIWQTRLSVWKKKIFNYLFVRIDSLTWISFTNFFRNKTKIKTKQFRKAVNKSRWWFNFMYYDPHEWNEFF